MSASDKASFLLYNLNEEERGREGQRNLWGREKRREEEEEGRRDVTQGTLSLSPYFLFFFFFLTTPLPPLHSVQHPLTSRPRTASVSIDWDTSWREQQRGRTEGRRDAEHVQVERKATE